ncbi:MAG: acyl carrier protein [Alphaproteobacteria bacterium]|nr:acyl carrier protein [Alphaproteobacteria bacterium]
MIKEDMIKMFSEQFGVDVDDINENMCFVNDLGADSIDIVELVMAIESKFKIQIEEHEYMNSSIIKDLINTVTNKVMQ